jgi:hypothetical protein
VLDKLPAAGQVALGQLVTKQLAPLREEIAKIDALPGVSESVRSELASITSKLSGLNLAQVSKDATGIFTSLTKTLNGLTDSASVEAAVPELERVSLQLDELQRVQSAMSPGGQSMLAKVVSTARGPLDALIEKVLARLGVDAAPIKPMLDAIVNKLAGLALAPRPA